MSYAQFEMSCAEAEDEDISEEQAAERSAQAVALARRVYERANTSLRAAKDKEERVLLLEAWRNFEETHGDDISQEKVKQRMPRRIKRRQRVQAEDGVGFKTTKYVNCIYTILLLIPEILCFLP